MQAIELPNVWHQLATLRIRSLPRSQLLESEVLEPPEASLPVVRTSIPLQMTIPSRDSRRRHLSPQVSSREHQQYSTALIYQGMVMVIVMVMVMSLSTWDGAGNMQTRHGDGRDAPWHGLNENLRHDSFNWRH